MTAIYVVADNKQYHHLSLALYPFFSLLVSIQSTCSLVRYQNKVVFLLQIEMSVETRERETMATSIKSIKSILFSLLSIVKNSEVKLYIYDSVRFYRTTLNKNSFLSNGLTNLHQTFTNWKINNKAKNMCIKFHRWRPDYLIILISNVNKDFFIHFLNLKKFFFLQISTKYIYFKLFSDRL